MSRPTPGRQRPPTQTERVRRALLASRRGITAADFIREPTADGGPPILRLPSRIVDVRPALKAEGYQVVTAGRRDNCVVYVAQRVAPQPAEWRLFFELLAKMGLRISEALGLDWPDVEFGTRPVLRVRRQWYRGRLKGMKTSNGRRDLPLPVGLACALWAARPPGASGPVFATSTGTRYADRNVRRVLDRATGRTAEHEATRKAPRPSPRSTRRPRRPPRENAGVPWVHFHTFRHTCASMLLAGGKNIRQVSEWLGHADPAFTLRTYVHLMDEGLGDADFLDAAVPPVPVGAEQEEPEAAAVAQAAV